MPTGVMPRAARKAAGVYYTPRPLVDSVVARTLGPLLEGETPAQVKLHVVDPSCGSGAFLVGVYDYLLEWYLRQYVADRPEAWAVGPSPALRQLLTGGALPGKSEDGSCCDTCSAWTSMPRPWRRRRRRSFKRSAPRRS